MTPFEKFMLQAQGRDPDLEEKLQAEKFRNLDRYFQIVFGRGLRPNERRLVESIAAALNTTVDDEYVMQIFVAGRGLVASHKLAEEVSAASTPRSTSGTRRSRHCGSSGIKSSRNWMRLN